jgi:hypothetical protein
MIAFFFMWWTVQNQKITTSVHHSQTIHDTITKWEKWEKKQNNESIHKDILSELLWWICVKIWLQKRKKNQKWTLSKYGITRSLDFLIRIEYISERAYLI